MRLKIMQLRIFGYICEEYVCKNSMNPKEDFAVRKILCVGEGTSKQKAIKEIFNAMAYPLYGMTETDTMVNLMVNS